MRDAQSGTITSRGRGGKSPGAGINTPRNTRPDKRTASIPSWLCAMDSCVPSCSACYRRAAHLLLPLPRGGCSQSTTSDPVYVPLCDCASWQSRKPWLHGSAVLSVVAATPDTLAWAVSPRGFLAPNKPCLSICPWPLAPHCIVTHPPFPVPTLGAPCDSVPLLTGKKPPPDTTRTLAQHHWRSRLQPTSRHRS